MGENEMRPWYVGFNEEITLPTGQLPEWDEPFIPPLFLPRPDFPRDAAAEAELLAGLPFLNLELVDGEAFRQFTEKTFATDRNLVFKGMVEVCQ
jgi:hypothetical protein